LHFVPTNLGTPADLIGRSHHYTILKGDPPGDGLQLVSRGDLLFLVLIPLFKFIPTVLLHSNSPNMCENESTSENWYPIAATRRFLLGEEECVIPLAYRKYQCHLSNQPSEIVVILRIGLPLCNLSIFISSKLTILHPPEATDAIDNDNEPPSESGDAGNVPPMTTATATDPFVDSAKDTDRSADNGEWTEKSRAARRKPRLRLANVPIGTQRLGRGWKPDHDPFHPKTIHCSP